MVISAILVALLATMGQWWFFGPVTKCLVYPLTTGLLTGIFMGDPMTGMLAGANIQLIYLGWISAGGTMPSNTIVAGIFGTAMTILSGASPTMAVTFAIPFSMFGLLLNQVYMTVNSFWIHRADVMLENGNIRGVRLMNFVPSFLVAFALYGIPAFALVMSGKTWGTALINAIQEPCNCAAGSRRDHACTWNRHAFKLSWKEKAGSVFLCRIFPDNLLKTGYYGRCDFCGNHCNYHVYGR